MGVCSLFNYNIAVIDLMLIEKTFTSENNLNNNL
jgi:hypothetical protein